MKPSKVISLRTADNSRHKRIKVHVCNIKILYLYLQFAICRAKAFQNTIPELGEHIVSL